MIPPSWCGRSAGTGVLRTRCIGCWTSPSARMTAACATRRRRATSPSCARSLSTWSPGTEAPKPASVAGARRLPGMTATCSRSSHTKLMREPWGRTVYQYRLDRVASEQVSALVTVRRERRDRWRALYETHGWDPGELEEAVRVD